MDVDLERRQKMTFLVSGWDRMLRFQRQELNPKHQRWTVLTCIFRVERKENEHVTRGTGRRPTRGVSFARIFQRDSHPVDLDVGNLFRRK